MKINVERRTNSDRQRFFNGSFKESFDALITSDGATIILTIGFPGGGDLTMQFSDGLTLLDCTTSPCTIELTAGADNSPQTNWVYILKSTKVLTKSTSGYPTNEEHIKVDFSFVPSATHVQSEGAYINQNWNDHLMNTNNMGHMLHIGEVIRYGVGYNSGIDPNGTDQSAGSSYFDFVGGTEVYFKATSGVVYQMHRHAMPAFDSGDGDSLHIINWNGDNYHHITNLADIQADSAGNSLSNKYFNVFFFAVGNKSGTYHPYMAKLPSGSYVTESSATNDVDKFNDLTMPREFILDSTVGVPVCLITMKWSGGFTTLSHISTVDLRGDGRVAGGGAAGAITSFADNQFTVFNVSDNTKIMTFDVSAVTTGNTRTFTFPDFDGIIATIDNAQTFTAAQIIDVSSATAFKVEDSGTLNNVLTVDTATNGRVGINIAPNVTAALMVSRGGTLNTIGAYVGGDTLDRGFTAYSWAPLIEQATGSSAYVGFNITSTIQTTAVAISSWTGNQIFPLITNYTGTINNMTMFLSSPLFFGAGATINNVFHYVMTNNYIGGTIGNQYGLYQSIFFDEATNNYGIYLLGATDGAIVINRDDTNTLDGALVLGADQDFHIYHDGTDGFVDCDTGDLKLSTASEFDFTHASADTDLVMNFIGTTFSGKIVWMEDEDMFDLRNDGASHFIYPGTTSLLNLSVTTATLDNAFSAYIWSTDPGDFLYGFYGGVRDEGANAVSLGAATATAGWNYFVGTNVRTHTTVYGGQFTTEFRNDNLTITTLYGLWTQPIIRGGKTGSATVGTAYGLYVQDSAATATITTAYGIYIEEMTTATTNYGMWVETDMEIFFRDDEIHIGSLTDGELDLTADVSINLVTPFTATTGEFRFYEGVNYVGFVAPSLAADQMWALPSADGDSAQAMRTNGSGALYFADESKVIITLTASENIIGGETVEISNTEAVSRATGATKEIIGVATATTSQDDEVPIMVLGVVVVNCSGTVTVGDLLVGAATGKVARFTPTTSEDIVSAGSHAHAISDEGATGSSTTDGAGAHTHPSISITSGEYSGGKIIGKALTGGTDELISIFVNLMG